MTIDIGLQLRNMVMNHGILRYCMLFSSPGNDLTWIMTMTYDLFAVVQHISGCGQPF